jgi:hypothetical protein
LYTGTEPNEAPSAVFFVGVEKVEAVKNIYQAPRAHEKFLFMGEKLMYIFYRRSRHLMVSVARFFFESEAQKNRDALSICPHPNVKLHFKKTETHPPPFGGRAICACSECSVAVE